MTLKLLHLNILWGRFLPRIIDFVKKQRFDILNLQEVGGGKIAYLGRDCFQVLKSHLGYRGHLTVTQKLKNDRHSYSGNAVFYKPSLKPLKVEEVWLKKFYELSPSSRSQEYPRCVQSVLFEKNGQKFCDINTHLPWGPTPVDKPYKLIQHERLYRYIRSLRHPFVLTGDFNLTSQAQIVKRLNRLARNLTLEHGLTNTLNPRTHRVKRLFPPGLAVDFAYVHPKIKVKNFRLVDRPDLSDHFGLVLEFEPLK